MIADRIVGSEREGFIIDLVAEEAYKLFPIGIVVGDRGAIPFPDAPILVLLRNKLYLVNEAVIPVVRVVDLRDVVIVVEDPPAALATPPTMQLKV